MPPIKVRQVLKTIERTIVEEVAEEDLYSPAKLEQLFGPPKGYERIRARHLQPIEVDPPPERLILKQKQPHYIEVDEPPKPVPKKPLPKPPEKLYLIPDKPSQIVEAASDAKDFWMPDPNMFPGYEPLVKAGNLAIVAGLAIAAAKLKEKEKLWNLAKQKTNDNSNGIDINTPTYDPAFNSGYDYLPEPVSVPGEAFETALPDMPVNTWIKVSYDVKAIPHWEVRRNMNTQEIIVEKKLLDQELTKVEMELLEPKFFGMTFRGPEYNYGGFGGAFYFMAKGIKIYGSTTVYGGVTRIWALGSNISSGIVSFSGDNGVFPYAWSPTQADSFRYWYSPRGRLISNLQLTPPLLQGEIVGSRIPTLKKQQQDEEEMPCDLSSVQQLLRYNITQNAQIQASVNGANLGINANIDTLKPPINATLSNTNSIASNVGELLNITGTTQTTVNSTATTANTIKQGVDTIPPKLNGIQSALDDIGPKTNSIKSTVDAMAPKIDDIKDGIGAIGRRIEDVWNKLGDIASQIGDRFDKLARWLRLPQLLSALTLIITLHNAAMLSNNLIQSLGEIIDIGLNVIGLKDENDQAFSISEILGKNANSLAATILGESNWNTTKEAWKKINNIYRAGANIIYSIQSICESMINILQIGAEATGKIGNALRKAGVVAENAYGWLPEQINLAIAQQTAFRGVLNQLRSLSDTTDSLQSAVSETRNIQTEFNELKEKKDKFDLELNKVTTAKSTAESTSKTHSQSPTINSSDLKPSS